MNQTPTPSLAKDLGSAGSAEESATEKPKESCVPLRVDLGCGQNKQSGFVGVDIVAMEGVDVVHDLLKFPWPFESSSVDEVFCSHVIEHLPHRAFGDVGPDPFFLFFDEVWRVMKVGAQAKFIAPYYASMRAWQDPTHQRAISDATALYLNKAWRVANKLDHYACKADFDFVTAYEVTGDWAVRSEEARQFAFRHYQNCIVDLHLILTKRA
jgi:hypothetical protein